MPGSLLFSNDAYSDLSETSQHSVKSLDSKIGAKKVSFNRAVRVKQYPWKPDLDYNSAEHLTLPSNRFWFKVHTNKQETQDFINPAEESFQSNIWNKDEVVNIHDSLAPIAEVEDLDLDYSNMKSKTTMKDRYYGAKINGLNLVNNMHNFNHPEEPPPDYLDDGKFVSNPNFYNGTKTNLESKQENENSSDNNNKVFNKNRLNHNPYCFRILEESDENVESRFTVRSATNRSPRTITRDSLPFRHSIRDIDTSDFLRNPERRSRSYDDHLDNRFQLRKADKSVSTDDLNSNHGSSCFTNRFLRGSRDMATQCYGTLTRDKNVTPFNGFNTSKQNNEEDRLNNFKSLSTLRKCFGDENAFAASVKVLQLKKDSQEKELFKCTHPYNYHPKNHLLSNEKILNHKKQDQSLLGKLSDGIKKPLKRSDSVCHRVQNQNGSPYKAQIKNPDLQSKPPLKGGPRNLRENNKTQTIHDTTSLGYLRGRQIPLSEMNTNTNCNIKNNKNETCFASNLYRTESKTPSSNRATKPDSTLTSVLRPKRSSTQENRNHKNGSHSAKSYRAEIDNSMIDWSLSGFQLVPKPDNAVSSVSDSEYTVHRRPPLLMYIPGVSHHDRPAVEDDRLSHLSDLPRSELNDGLNSSGDLRRQYSMPREGKLKWIKWRNREKCAKRTFE